MKKGNRYAQEINNALMLYHLALASVFGACAGSS